MVAFTAAVPRTVVPSVNLTPAVGLPPLAPKTVAVKVTACPLVDGFGVDVSVVVVGALLTVTVTAAEVLPINVTAGPE